MAHYTYKAVDTNGSLVKGVVEGTDIDSIRDTISAKGLSVVSIKRTSELISSIRGFLTRGRVKRKDVIEFAKNLSIMLKAGMPITVALDEIEDGMENKYLRQNIRNISESIKLGSSFSEALAAQGEFLPDILVSLTRIGEETGRLEKSLSDVAEHLQRMENLASAIKRALMYPMFVLAGTFLALLFWLIYVMPKILKMIREMGVSLPLPTRILIHISNFSQNYWYLLVFSPLIIFAVIQLIKRDERVRYYIDMAKINMPIVKLIVYNKLLALFAEQMRILTTTGITIDRSLAIVSDIIDSKPFKDAIENVRVEIGAGSRISDAMRKHRIFPSLMVRLINIGEASGNLEEQFSFLAAQYLDKLDDISQKMGKMIEPIIISVVGIMFAFMMVGLLLPIYDLISSRIGG